MIVLGIDPSLTGTGIAVVDTTDHLVIETHTIETKPTGTTINQRLARLRKIVREVDHWALMLQCGDEARADLVVIEAPAYDSRTGHQHERSGLWWLLIDRLHTLGIPVAEVTTGGVKKYATGKGNAPKDAVLLAVARRWSQAPVTNNNEADAVVLACMGADAYTGTVGEVPKVNRDALSKVDWPTLPEERVA